jgi:hypothetical protein
MSGAISRTNSAFAAIPAAVALFAAVALSGCQQLFTTSLAAPLARDTVTLPKTLTASEAADLAAQAKDEADQKLATAVVETLVDQITDPSTQTELAAAAASAAVTASGAGAAAMDAFGEALNSGNLDDLDAAALLADIQAGITPDVIAALGFLDPETGIADPAALTGTDLSPTDYLIAAIVIAASALPAGADPTNLTTEQQDDFTNSDECGIAGNILNEALTMVEPGSQAADLLNQFRDLFSLPL